ncbi:MAG: hypothetical protein SOX94_05710 [Prevotella sp.]|nr:hypothetical protein [Prevotella sp.]
MISNIKTVTLRLSQKEFNFLMNGINTKFFMDIMSHLTASFSMDEDDTDPQLVYGPTAFFHLYELSERWKVAPEDVLNIMFNLEQNGLIKYSFAENEFAIEPCITSFVSTDDVVHKGTNSNTPLDELCFEMMTKKQIFEAIARYDSLITLHFSMVTLKAFSLKKDENEDTYESINGVVVNP